MNHAIFWTQTVRHIHLYFFGDETSVLEKFQEFSTQKERIQRDRSLESLLSEYEEGKIKVIELEKGLKLVERQDVRNKNEELFSRVRMLESEIRQRESRNREIRDMLLFSLAGLALILGGVVFYKNNKVWIGMALIIPGFMELIWWTKPDFFGGGAFREYGNLLVVKIGISLLALILLNLLYRKSVNKSLESNSGKLSQG